MNAQSQLTPFNFNQTAVRVINRDGEAWFVAQDVSNALEYATAKDMVRCLDDDEKDGHIVPTLGGNQKMLIINESGLYHALFKSRKKEAQAFRRWVTSEVLPSIRKTGAYQANAQSSDWIDPQRRIHLRRLVEHRACYLNRSAQKIWSEVRLVTGAGSIHFLSQKQYEQAVAYLGGFPLRGQQIERFPVTVSGADIHNFSSFMKVFRQIVDEADFLRDMAKISGSSKMMGLWSLIDSANFMSGSAQRMEAKLIGVGMESHDSIACLTRG